MNIESFAGKKVHFIGIGGISMHGLAKMLLAKGYKISGSDMNYSQYFEELEELGAKCFSPHAKGQQEGADLIVKNSAIPETNVELMDARQANIPVMERTELLSQLMESSKIAFGVSGTHGKTTCSSMLVTILELCGIDPTVHIGGELEIIGGATKTGGDIFVAEACEYKDNYHRLCLDGAIVLNIDEDHLDYFKDLEQIIESFNTYICKLPSGGVVIINNDDKNIYKAIKGHKCPIITFGVENKSEYTAINLIESDDACYSFDLMNNAKVYKVSLGVPGKHHVYNALAAIAAAIYCGCDIESACKAVGKYSGAKRRFELTGNAENGAVVYHDYAHHPREVKVNIKAAKKRTKGKLICVFQPHTYSRTRELLSDFAKSFDDTDVLIITDIYAAREKNPGNIHATDLVNAITESNKNIVCKYADSFQKAANEALTNSTSNDLIITFGAGDIQKVNNILCSKS